MRVVPSTTCRVPIARQRALSIAAPATLLIRREVGEPVLYIHRGLVTRADPTSLTSVTSKSTADVDKQNNTVLHQLRRVRELASRVAKENSKYEKQRIIANYPDLRELLEYVYQPNLRTHLSFSTLLKHVYQDPLDDVHEPTSIINLLDLLASRKVTGNQAKNTVWQFLVANGVTDAPEGDPLYVFGRLLDRNLVAGFGTKTLQEVRWENDGHQSSSIIGPPPTAEIVESQLTSSISDTATDAAERSPTTSTSQSVPSAASNALNTPVFPNLNSLQQFQVALGKSIEPPFSQLFSAKTGSSVWYASRKLDGVRAITFVDFIVPSDPVSPLTVASVHFVSRSGKEFFSLGKLEQQFLHLGESHQIRQWLSYDNEIIEQHKGGVVKRLVLDGEVCVMRPKTEAERTASSLRHDGSAASAIWTANDPYVEDFPSTVSAMRRKDTVSHLSYFLFDVLSWAEVKAGGALNQEGLGKTFGERIQDVKDLSGWLNGELDKQGVDDKIVKDLVQWKVKDMDEIDGMVKRAADEGWEGLIFRAEKPYRGKRSPDIRKFKKWQDAEYLVVSADTSKMRLALNGVFAEHEALANVWIEHNGHKVSVGSGFTADQRIRYGRNPQGIVGKMITVEYFSESDKVGREEKSLRFPRVKMIWEEGKREI